MKIFKSILLVLLSSFLFTSCLWDYICGYPESPKINADNKNAQIYVLNFNDSEKLADLKTNFESSKQISIKQGEQILFQSELKQNLESKFEWYSTIIYDSFPLNDAFLKTGNLLFTLNQNTEPSVKIIVQWTKQDENKTYISPIYTIIIPPQNRLEFKSPVLPSERNILLAD